MLSVSKQARMRPVQNIQIPFTKSSQEQDQKLYYNTSLIHDLSKYIHPLHV